MLPLRLIVLFAALGIGAFAVWFHRAVTSTESHILLGDHGADWIRVDEPTNLLAQAPLERGVAFRTVFRVTRPTPATPLSVRAMKHVAAFLDGSRIHADPPGFDHWMRVREIVLPGMAEGVHELSFVVRAADCYPAMIAHAELLGLRTGANWEASEDGVTWQPVMLAKEPHPPEFARKLPPSPVALGRIAGWLVLIFVLAGTMTVLHARGIMPTISPGRVRWIAIAVWTLLALNNIFKLPAYVGMDIDGHLEYVRYLLTEHRLPLATEGWQMFQSPLYYLISAPLLAVVDRVDPSMMEYWLRVVSLGCGIAQVQLCFRAVRAVFPGREGLQILGTLAGGFVPMNLYISQVIGNEPLAGLLCGWAIVLTLEQSVRQAPCLTMRFAMKLGTVLGLAFLAKATSVLLIAVLGSFLVWRTLTEPHPEPRTTHVRRAAVAMSLLGAVIVVVAGWYYARNWVLLGRPFVGGWDSSRGIAWWQDHGYVTLQSLCSFGTALIHPIYAQTAGFWDGLYGTLWLDGSMGSVGNFEFWPPWNRDFVVAGALLALIPSIAMLSGAIRGLREPAVALGVVAITVYTAAILALHVSVLPSYSTIKSTYLLGLLPCMAILLARGFALVPSHVWVRAAANGLFACWLVSALFGYIVL